MRLTCGAAQEERRFINKADAKVLLYFRVDQQIIEHGKAVVPKSY